MTETPLAETALTDTSVDASAPAADEAAPAADPAAEAAPVEAAPVEAAPVEAAPVEAAPVEAVPAEAAPVETAPAPEPAATPDPAAAPDPSDAAPVKSTTASVEPAAKATAKPAARAVAKHATRKAAAAKRHAAARARGDSVPGAHVRPAAVAEQQPRVAAGASVVAITSQYLGVPYVWGGAVPATGFDCSGLTRFVYQQLGIQLPHYAAWQFAMFPKLDPADLAPGDLVFFEPRIDGPGHVAMYVGGDQIIAAPHTGALVRYSSLSGTAAALGFMGAVRPYGATAIAVVEQDLGPQWSGSMQVSLLARPE